MYDCEFQEDGSNLLLISAKNNNFARFIGKSFARDTWDMISKADFTYGIKHDQLYNYLLDHLKKGNTVFNQLESNILLKKGEYVKFQSFHSVELHESKSVRVSKSAHSGRHSRNMGISYGIGNSVSVSESFDEIKKVDVGQITITNKRFIFSGAKKSIDVDIKKITSITPYTDGIKLQRKNKQKVEYFVNLDDFIFTREWGGETYLFCFNGNMIKALIESSLDDLKYISDLQLYEAQSIPQIEKNNSSLNSFNYDNISIKYPSSWNMDKNINNAIFELKNDNNYSIRFYIEEFVGNEDDLKSYIIDGFKKLNYSTFGFKDMKINNILMHSISFLVYNSSGVLAGSIFTFFCYKERWYAVRLIHELYDDAKNDYFELVNSINID